MIMIKNLPKMLFTVLTSSVTVRRGGALGDIITHDIIGDITLSMYTNIALKLTRYFAVISCRSLLHGFFNTEV